MEQIKLERDACGFCIRAPELVFKQVLRRAVGRAPVPPFVSAFIEGKACCAWYYRACGTSWVFLLARTQTRAQEREGREQERENARFLLELNAHSVKQFRALRVTSLFILLLLKQHHRVSGHVSKRANVYCRRRCPPLRPWPCVISPSPPPRGALLNGLAYWWH